LLCPAEPSPERPLAQAVGLQLNQAVVFYGIADARLSEVVELYPTREKAETALAEVLFDEPDWRDVLSVVPVILGGEAEPSLN
jgi:hypothetical protein